MEPRCACGHEWSYHEAASFASWPDCIAACSECKCSDWAAGDGCCFYCGKSCVLDKEHQTPLSRGGSDGIDNIVGTCPSCNSRKGAMTADEYAAYLAWQE